MESRRTIFPPTHPTGCRQARLPLGTRCTTSIARFSKRTCRVDLVELTRLRSQYACGTLKQPLERALIAAGGPPVLVGSRDVFDAHPAPAPAKPVKLSSRNFKPGGPVGPKADADHGLNRENEAQVHVRLGTVVPAPLDLGLSDDTKPGWVHTFQVRQPDHTGKVVGGVRFMALAATEEVINACGQRHR